MTKSELRSGMVIELTNGAKGIVFLNGAYGDTISFSDGMYGDLSDFKDDLTNNSAPLDIIKVYQPSSKADLGSYKNLELLWTRIKTYSVEYTSEDNLVEKLTNKIKEGSVVKVKYNGEVITVYKTLEALEGAYPTDKIRITAREFWCASIQKVGVYIENGLYIRLLPHEIFKIIV